MSYFQVPVVQFRPLLLANYILNSVLDYHLATEQRRILSIRTRTAAVSRDHTNTRANMKCVAITLVTLSALVSTSGKNEIIDYARFGKLKLSYKQASEVEKKMSKLGQFKINSRDKIYTLSPLSFDS